MNDTAIGFQGLINNQKQYAKRLQERFEEEGLRSLTMRERYELFTGKASEETELLEKRRRVVAGEVSDEICPGAGRFWDRVNREYIVIEMMLAHAHSVDTLHDRNMLKFYDEDGKAFATVNREWPMWRGRLRFMIAEDFIAHEHQKSDGSPYLKWTRREP